MQSGFARDLGFCMGMGLKWYRKNDAGFDSEYAVRVCAGFLGEWCMVREWGVFWDIKWSRI